jgi:hypothetical protein
MKLGMFIVVPLLAVWLALWAVDIGILVYSSDTGVLRTRDCRYLVGVTLEKKFAPLSQRCPVLSR